MRTVKSVGTYRAIEKMFIRIRVIFTAGKDIIKKKGCRGSGLIVLSPRVGTFRAPEEPHFTLICSP
jgi:hypothetical protein